MFCRFGSVEEIKLKSADEIATVDGVSHNLAQRILDNLNPERDVESNGTDKRADDKA